MTFHQFIFFDSDDLISGSEVPENMIPNDDHDAGGLPNKIDLCISARVMLLRNIFTSDGLVNGAISSVHSFEFDQSGSVAVVNVLFDDDTTGQSLKLKESNAVGIERIELKFLCGGRKIVRSQFPLALAWACTIHKIQGLSLNKICIDIGRSVFEKGMAYVALSRVKTLSGLYFLCLNPTIIQPPNGSFGRI